LPNLFARLAEATTRLTTARAWTITVALLLIASIADHFSGPQINFVPIYMVITSLAAWCLGEKVGVLIGLFGIVLTTQLNGLGNAFPSQGPHLSSAALFWNMSWRIVFMSLLVVLASGLRCALDQARWSAATDGLTGVLNKAAFLRRLGPLVSQAQRRGDSLVVAYIDLDGFKGVNDGFGHAAGDMLLRQFAESAVGAIRAHDLFARIGGDEFIALLTVASCPQGDTAAERLHDRLSRILRDIGHDVTCSVGALVLDSRQVTLPERMIEAADELMYEVKHSGKNALRIARADLQPGALQAFVPVPDRRQRPQGVVGRAA
jgi:diguanylate cyclase (GGDEF)-like protein